jgi:3-oxoacyl-[acyl-carrier-protein] synthase III
VKKQEEKKIIRALNNKHARKHRITNSMISVYVPREIKSKIETICKTKKLKTAQWVRSVIIEKLGNSSQRKYNCKLNKLVKAERKTKKKRKGRICHQEFIGKMIPFVYKNWKRKMRI